MKWNSLSWRERIACAVVLALVILGSLPGSERVPHVLAQLLGGGQ